MENKTTQPIAACGLYCGGCKSYKKGKCPGCFANEKANWCGIRTCCIEHNYASCADCTEFTNVNDCKKFNNFIGKVMGVLFNSNRAACINRIREIGYAPFAAEMDAKGLMSLKRR